MLLNCPFHRLADGHTEVVCAMNGAFLGGAAAAAAWTRTGSRLSPSKTFARRAAAQPAQCCARIRPSGVRRRVGAGQEAAGASGARTAGPGQWEAA